MPSAAAEHPAEPATVAPSLERLREQLAATIGGSDGAATRNGADSSAAALPFDRRDSPSGALYVRRERYRPNEPVGAVALGAAIDAEMDTLALLGLTPELARCSVDGALYFDTETTGFGGAGTLAFLVGMAWYDPTERTFVLEQLLLKEPGVEAPLLERVAARWQRASYLASYNGKSFDLPLLRTRLVLNRLPPLPERPHLDLLHLVRRVHAHRRWRKTLGSAERHVLQYDRGPDLAGEDVAQRYPHFLRTGDHEALRDVVAHNLRDVRSLIALVGWYGEPLERLGADELANVARTAQRAGRVERARELADHAVHRAATPKALATRAALAKARGDKHAALADFEALAEQVDDPAVRLELAKLYEHYLRAPAQALDVARAGTLESEEDQRKRRERLRRKLERMRRANRGK